MGIGVSCPCEQQTEDVASRNRWTLFTCSGRSHTVDSDLQSSLPIPPGCRRTLAVRVKSGGALVGFAGPGTAAFSKQFFDQAFREREWTRATEWTQHRSKLACALRENGAGQL